MEDKSNFRKNVIKKRKSIEKSLISSNSRLIFENLLKLGLFDGRSNIMVYLDFNNEVETKPIIDHLFSTSKNVLVPISVVKTKQLVVSKIESLDDVEVRTYGIREPRPEKVDPVEHDQIDLVIVPGVAFDEDGFRLGYGGGFYDRFIKNLRPDCISVAIAFEDQVFKEVPKEDHDISVDFLITEKRIIKVKK